MLMKVRSLSRIAASLCARRRAGIIRSIKHQDCFKVDNWDKVFTVGKAKPRALGQRVVRTCTYCEIKVVYMHYYRV
jgi:hypothetical protein